MSSAAVVELLARAPVTWLSQISAEHRYKGLVVGAGKRTSNKGGQATLKPKITLVSAYFSMEQTN
jgi:hypothetical protein